MVTRNITVRQFADFTKAFPGQMTKLGFRVNELLAKSYQRRIRRRAMGRLKKVSVIAKGKENLSVQYPDVETFKIAKFVNDGAVPQFSIPRELMEASRAGKSTAGQKSTAVLGNLENPHFVRPRKSKSQGFITKSMDTLQRDTPNIIEKEIQRAFNEM